MLSTGEFKEFAKDYVLFLHVTSHLAGEKYPELLSDKGGQGWPYVVAMDAEGNVLSFLGYEDMTVGGFRAMMARAKEMQALLAKKDRTGPEEFRVLSTQLKGGTIQAAEFREKAGAVKGLGDAEAKELEGLLVHIDYMAEMKKWRDHHSPDAKYRLEAGKVFAGMLAAGRIPSEQNERGAFCQFTIDYAESVKDVPLFEKALGILKEDFGSDPRAKDFFKMMDGRLEKVKAPPEAKPEEKPEEKKDPPDAGKKEGDGK